uniref:NADH-ubiquinone oxidoreductase chain 4L n=1 Tax=Anastrangalia sequensi TaxID=763898 RepID=A0A343ERF7_9CUCU|nr:NADH dehydrogenase subunit 4L [Anastrangalia sequensi]ASL05663.1 NADH dehydrogenase subunit 4L [Anastrangalia sequensi]
MVIYFYLTIFMFLMGLIVYSSKRKHLLLMLLSLEFIVLSLYLNMFVYLSILNFGFFFSMIFLTMSVWEGALGFSILVLKICTPGKDYILTFFCLW